jgi:hypothetical protein
MAWKIEYTDEFKAWWQQLDSTMLESVAVSIKKFVPLADKLYAKHLANLE